MLKLQCSSLRMYLEITAKVFLDYVDSINLIDMLYIQVYQEKLKKKLHQQSMQQFLYPFVLMLFYIALVFFYRMIFSQELSALIASMQQDTIMIRRLNRIVNVHVGFIFFLFVLVVVFYIIYRQKDLYILLLVRLNSIKKHNILTKISSYQFVQYFNLFYRKGVDTKHILNLLRLRSFPVSCRWLAYHLEQSFQQGKSWQVAYLDPNLLLFMYESGSKAKIEENFARYLHFTESVLSLKLKRLSLLFKGFVFFLLIQIIFIYYQSLYLPLSILEGL